MLAKSKSCKSSPKKSGSLNDPQIPSNFGIKTNEPSRSFQDKNPDKLNDLSIHTRCSECNFPLNVHLKGKEFDPSNKEMWNLVKLSEIGVVASGIRKGYRAMSPNEKAETISEKCYIADHMRTELEGSRFVACPKCKHYVLFIV